MKNNRYFTFCVLDFISITFILFLIFTNNFTNFFDGLIILGIFLFMYYLDLKNYKKFVHKDRKEDN